MVVIVLLLLK